MTEISRFWDGTVVGDATISPYDAGTEFAQVMMSISMGGSVPNRGGMWADELGGLLPTKTGANTLSILSGRAIVYGTWYQNDATLGVTIPTPSGATRIDVIVLRKSWSAQTVRITRIAGAEGGGAPSITQSVGTTWDIPICQVSMTTAAVMTITDLREFINLASSRLSKNLLINGGFEIWERGAGPITANNAYTADRWQISLGGGSSISVSRDSTHNVPDSWFCASIVYTHGAQSFLFQKMESGLVLQLRGRILTFSMRVSASAANAARLYAEDGVNTWTSNYHSGSGSYETLGVVLTLTPTSSSLTLRLALEASATVYIDNAMLVEGNAAGQYIPLLPAEDLLNCQRFYEWHGAGSSSPAHVGQMYGLAGTALEASVSWHVRKAVTPTMTKTGTWAVTNCGQPTVVGDTDGYHLSTTVTANGMANAYPDSGDDQIVGESNP